MTWLAEQGTYLSGQEAIDSLDIVAAAAERKFGCDRLRLLVDENLRTRFDRQRAATNAAITKGELADVQRECKRMIRAWQVLDETASANPANLLPPDILEVAIEDGSVVQIVRDATMAGLQAATNIHAGRRCVVFTLDEVGRILSKMPSLFATKQAFPGATVTKVRTRINDPLDGLASTTQ